MNNSGLKTFGIVMACATVAAWLGVHGLAAYQLFTKEEGTPPVPKKAKQALFISFAGGLVGPLSLITTLVALYFAAKAIFEAHANAQQKVDLRPAKAAVAGALIMLVAGNVLAGVAVALRAGG